MKRSSSFAAVGLFVAVMSCVAAVVQAGPVSSESPSLRYKLSRDQVGVPLRVPPLDAAKVVAAEADSGKGRPLRYAISHAVAADPLAGAKSVATGHWQDVGDGMKLWRLRIEAPGALSIDVAFKPLRLPEAAALYFTDASGRFVRGPYTRADVAANGEFWTPFVPGDVAFVEVLLPAKSVKQLRLELFNVNQAFRDIVTGQSPFQKSGSCNVDVVCPQGDAHRPQIRAVARYSVGGGLCTGQLINNTANDGKRLFITANHCIDSQADANSVVAYWNYESPTCRTVGSGSNGTPISVSGNAVVQPGGALLRANHAASDTALIELNTSIPAAVTPFWDGWDRSEGAQPSAAVVHHPQGDEKRISFENNALSLSDAAVPGVPGSRHWRIADWDVGTTEPGSSGSGLLSAQKRVIGVLSGGAAACGNNSEDYFGRLGVAWEGGGSASTRVRDWLDPLNLAAFTLDGRAACAAPSISLSRTAGTPTVDAAVMVTATVSGGVGPYTVRWDVDGDGVVDRVTTSVTQSASIPVRYPAATTVNIAAAAIGADSCAAAASLLMEVSAPDVVATSGAPTQVCGDGDAAIEPGERWQLPVQLQNVGGNGLNNAYAQFTPISAGEGVSTAPRDTYGYRVVDNSSPSCAFQPVNMAGATVVATDEADDGISAGLAVGGAAPFRLYGQNVTQLYMATNGYLSSNAADDGGDFSNDCLSYGSFFDNNARLHILFDDLVVQGSGNLRHQHFATCPRPSDAGAAQGCTVFEWNNVGRYSSSSTPPVGNAVFQAVLYDLSYEIVYQYLSADPLGGGGASINIENAAKTDRLAYGCDTVNQAPTGRAVCFFEPAALPAGQATAALSLEGAAQQALPDLASGQSTQRQVPFQVPSSASCGAPFGVRYVGTVDDFSSSNRSTTLYSGTLGNGASCQTSSCSVAVSPAAGMPRDGLYTIVNRSGNGIGMFNINAGASIATAGTWFSGRADRQPTWYLLNGTWNPNDRRADLNFFQFTQSAPNVFPTSGIQVGTGVLTHDGAGDDYVMSWTIAGRSRMDKLSRTFANANVGQANHTGLWNSAGQSGWGVLFDEHINAASSAESLAVDYLYDSAGAPTWVLGAASNLSGTMPMNVYQVHCPWCPNLTDFASATFSAAGSQTRSYNDSSNGLFGASINVPATSTNWSRSDLPIRLLTTPLQ